MIYRRVHIADELKMQEVITLIDSDLAKSQEVWESMIWLVLGTQKSHRHVYSITAAQPYITPNGEMISE